MEGFIAVFGIIISYVILYFVIKAAVKNGIIEARQTGNAEDSVDSDGNQIPQKNCPDCNKKHDFDYPKCPYCDYQY
jgi:hypothetical protein